MDLDAALDFVRRPSARRAMVSELRSRAARRLAAPRKGGASARAAIPPEFEALQSSLSEGAGETSELACRTFFDEKRLEAVIAHGGGRAVRVAREAAAERVEVGGRGLVSVAADPETRAPGILGVRVGASPRERILARLRQRVGEDVDTGRAAVGIDWRRDPLTGYRWESLSPSYSLVSSPRPGVEVRSCWEIGRLLHLPSLALAFGASARCSSDDADVWMQEFVQCLSDFLRGNPPGEGIHWTSGMEVAVRVSNAVLGFAILDALDAPLKPEHRALVERFLVAHLVFSLRHPDYKPHLVHNHRLVQLCGEVIASSALSCRGGRLVPWAARVLIASGSELLKEIERQFCFDGANFEGAVGYHAFALQACIYALAFLRRGLPFTELSASSEAVELAWKLDFALARLSDAVRFLDALTYEGRMCLVGDYDESRFIVLEDRSAWPLAVVGAGCALTGASPFHNPVCTSTAQALLVDAMGSEPNLLEPHPGGNSSRQRRRSPESVSSEPSYRRLGGEPVASSSFMKSSKSSRMDARSKEAPELAFWIVSRWDRTTSEKKRALVFGSGRQPAIYGDRYSRGRLPLSARELLQILSGGKPPAHLYMYGSVGLYLTRDEGLHLVLRCGAVGQGGWGGHSHSDQLSLSLWMGDARPLYDPGTPCYAAFPELRWAYRSGRAHNGPRAPWSESLQRWRSLFGTPFAVSGSPLLVSRRMLAGKWETEGSSFCRTVIVAESVREISDLLGNARVDFREQQIQGDQVSGEASSPSWVVAVLDWVEGNAELAEPATFPETSFWAVLGPAEIRPG